MTLSSNKVFFVLTRLRGGTDLNLPLTSALTMLGSMTLVFVTKSYRLGALSCAFVHECKHVGTDANLNW